MRAGFEVGGCEGLGLVVCGGCDDCLLHLECLKGNWEIGGWKREVKTCHGTEIRSTSAREASFCAIKAGQTLLSLVTNRSATRSLKLTLVST